MASNYIAGHMPSARGAKKSADRNLRSPDGYATLAQGASRFCEAGAEITNPRRKCGQIGDKPAGLPAVRLLHSVVEKTQSGICKTRTVECAPSESV